jgi:hypothetical protein
MATWQEAVAWMTEKPGNYAHHDGLHLYRIRNKQVERGYWQGGKSWEPHVINETLAMSDKWELTKPF